MEEENMWTLEVASFDHRYNYKFSNDMIASADNIDSLMKGMLGSMRENFSNIKLEKSKSGQYTQYSGTGIQKGDNKKFVIICSFFKHKQNTYCIVNSLPKDKYGKTQGKIAYILDNVERLKDLPLE